MDAQPLATAQDAGCPGGRDGSVTFALVQQLERGAGLCGPVGYPPGRSCCRRQNSAIASVAWARLSVAAPSGATRTRLERTFDPAFVQRLKDAATADISIGGPHLVAEAVRAGLVDEYWMLVCPIIVGSGTPFLPDAVK